MRSQENKSHLSQKMKACWQGLWENARSPEWQTQLTNPNTKKHQQIQTNSTNPYQTKTTPTLPHNKITYLFNIMLVCFIHVTSCHHVTLSARQHQALLLRSRASRSWCWPQQASGQCLVACGFVIFPQIAGSYRGSYFSKVGLLITEIAAAPSLPSSFVSLHLSPCMLITEIAAAPGLPSSFVSLYLSPCMLITEIAAAPSLPSSFPR